MTPAASRLRRALREARRLLEEVKLSEDTAVGQCNQRQVTELLKYIKRIGFLLSLVKQEMQANADNSDKRETATTEVSLSGDDVGNAPTVVDAAEAFLSQFLDSYFPHLHVPVACVGLVARHRAPKQPFAVCEPFLIHEDSNAPCVRASIQLEPSPTVKSSTTPAKMGQSGGGDIAITNMAARSTNASSLISSSAFSSAPQDADDAAQKQVINEINDAIREIKEGALRVSDIMNQEKGRLEENAALLQRGVDGTTSQCKKMDRVGSAFGGGPVLPHFLRALPGVEVFWDSILAPLWRIIAQAVFICAIVAVTGGTVMLMLVTPKSYVYER
ncbi:uncharacterized protein TEOVI_000325900 [Trypanosoma equiperdum]|uniref:Uncharacterized protein n=3 Tax=Trypanozoon TaxID=39700 RepID=Q57Y13_TRYB2|nr:hypothetical protein, conserved [Trypanosoma brucei brucei TREU927]AAX69521.1 hypothetical protein, conserved [Trypanosoma brucei]AAX80104.1 hypothetical protein Tb04.30K5.460 [Trypanosoma brucei]AAZ11000.1 hypothetical protein, conserved [Trypanosoma brucei brucei TREU927]SCU71678.1 hypothetical protein, conserved [Trypanosoma equiperdum]